MTSVAVRRPISAAVAVATATAVFGFAATRLGSTAVSQQMLPWIVGRGLGIAGFLALTVLTLTGLWLRHPWRLRSAERAPSGRFFLWLHASLAATALVLVIGHIGALAIDKFAGVGWTGSFVPGAAHYRPTAVALGTLGLYLGLLAAAAVALAGRLLGRHWVPVHRVAIVAFALVWLHAILAGSDTSTLMPMYAAAGGAVAALATTRAVMGRPSIQEPA